MKAFATIGLGSLGSISFQHAISALPADRPHGIPSDSWIRLDERLGVVIGAARPNTTGIPGYFMVKQSGIWHPLLTTPNTTETPHTSEPDRLVTP
jgi:hypothetical protein